MCINSQRWISRKILVRTRSLHSINDFPMTIPDTDFRGRLLRVLKCAGEAFKTLLARCLRCRDVTKPFFALLSCCSSCIVFVSRLIGNPSLFWHLSKRRHLLQLCIWIIDIQNVPGLLLMADSWDHLEIFFSAKMSRSIINNFEVISVQKEILFSNLERIKRSKLYSSVNFR